MKEGPTPHGVGGLKFVEIPVVGQRLFTFKLKDDSLKAL